VKLTSATSKTTSVKGDLDVDATVPKVNGDVDVYGKRSCDQIWIWKQIR